MFKKWFGPSWKTSLAGYVTYAATGVAVFQCLTCTGDCNLVQCILTAVTGGTIGTGLVLAKDHNVSGTGS